MASLLALHGMNDATCASLAGNDVMIRLLANDRRRPAPPLSWPNRLAVPVFLALSAVCHRDVRRQPAPVDAAERLASQQAAFP